MPVKVAVVGAGSMGMNHLRVLRDFSEEQAQLVGREGFNFITFLY